MLKFQDKIMGRLSKYELENLPNSICIMGERGSGKTSLIEWFVSRFPNVVFVEDTEVTSDLVMSATMAVTPTFYHIDIKKMTEKNQNMLLKLLEEPPKMVYIILEAESKFQLLPTILNRVQVFELSQYSEHQLREFLTTDTTIDISACKTPGEVLSLSSGDNNTLPTFTRSILSNIKKASYGSILNIPKRFADFDKDGKYSFSLFTRLLLKYSATYLSSGSSDNFRIFDTVHEFVGNCNIPNIDKQKLLESFLFALKEVMNNA